MARKAAPGADSADKPKPRAKPKAKSKSKKKELSNRQAATAIFLIGLFAVVLATLEGFVFKSTGVYTGRSGTFTFDPITSTLVILGGLIAMGFAVWCWFNEPKS
jgi:hypothetical protein